MKHFEDVNEYAKDGGIVIFGSTYTNSIPFCELAQDFDTDIPVYNRSIDGLSIVQAQDLIDQCILDLNPCKVFISIGDEDIKKADFDIDVFVEKYQWLLYTLHSQSRAKIYIVSVVSDDYKARSLNEKLKKIAKQSGCTYVDCAGVLHAKTPSIRFFDIIRFYMRNRPITFGQAFANT